MDKKILDKLFKVLLSDLSDVRLKKSLFKEKLKNVNFLKDFYYVVGGLLLNYPDIKITSEFLQHHLQFNPAMYTVSKNCTFVDYTEFSNDMVDKLEELREVAIEELDKLSADFSGYLQIVSDSIVHTQGINILKEATTFLTDGNKGVSGYEAMKEFLSKKLSELDTLQNDELESEGLLLGTEDLDDTSYVPQKICNYGIPSLDEAWGGIYDSEMTTFLAPPKGGKTRFVTKLLHNALLAKQSIVVWSLENGVLGFRSALRARHFYHFYNKGDTYMGDVCDDDIKKDTLESEMKELERVSYADLTNNTAHGKAYAISADVEFDVDTFIDVIDKHVTALNAKIICIDYLQLLPGKPGMAKNEVIAKAYQRLLRYIKRKKIAALLPAQFRQLSLGNLSKLSQEDLDKIDLRDSAGESAEVIRTPDNLMALYGTVEDIRSGRLALLGLPSRSASPFLPIQLNAQFGSCTFEEVEKQGSIY